MKLIGVQLDTVWEDKLATFDRVRRLLEAAKPQPGALLVLPEMYSTGFSMNVAAIDEGTDRPAERFLQSIAREYAIYTLGGVVTAGADGRGRNQALAYSPDGREIVRYDKMQPFTLGGEAKHYTAGECCRSFDWQGMKVAPFVCYDLRFPEHFRVASRENVQLIAVIANWPYPRESHWTTLLQARAIENQAYVIGVNRAGRDPRHTYFGRSLIIDPHGNVLADAGKDECLLSADVDPMTVDAWRRDFPALADAKGAFRGHADRLSGILSRR